MLIDNDTLNSDLESVADAIRAKGKTTAKLKFPSGMVSAIGNIKNEEAVTEFSQQNEKVTAYMAASEAYTDDDFTSVTVVGDYKDSTQITWERPNSAELTVSEGGTVYVMDEETGRGWSEAITSGTNTLTNFVPGHWYTCVARNGSGKIIGIHRMKGNGQVRMIFAPNSVHNFRDIGGWACDGGTVNYGLIYRGAQLSYYSTGSDAVYSLINSTGIHYLRDICGIRCEIDMRTDAQVTGISSSPLGDDVEYLHFPYSDASYTDIVNPNGSYAKQTKEMIVKIMQNIANGIPTYIHCQAGADRTGTICMVLEALLGVSGRDCDKDFELTTFYHQGSYYRPRTDSNWVSLRKYFNGLNGDTLQDKVATWCKLMKIEPSIINKFRKKMIDGACSDINFTILAITEQPQDYIGKAGEDILIYLEAEGDSVTYKWQYSSDGGNTWYDLSNLGITDTTDGFYIPGQYVTTEFNGSMVRCIVFDNSGDSVISRIVSLTVSEEVYTVTLNLTNCSASNNITTIAKGSSYVNTITADNGYQLSSVVCTMGGTSQTVTDGAISIDSVTGDIVLTVVAEEIPPENQLPLATDADGNAYNGGAGYKSGYRLSSSGAESAASGYFVTGFIPCVCNQTVTFKNIHLPHSQADGNGWNMCYIAVYDSTKTKIAVNYSKDWSSKSGNSCVSDENSEWIESMKMAVGGGNQDISKMAYFRISSSYIGDDSEIYVK